MFLRLIGTDCLFVQFKDESSKSRPLVSCLYCLIAASRSDTQMQYVVSKAINNEEYSLFWDYFVRLQQCHFCKKKIINNQRNPPHLGVFQNHFADSIFIILMIGECGL